MSLKTSISRPRTGRAFAFALVAAVIASQSACVPPEDVARQRAHVELECDGPIYVSQVLSASTYEASGCGRRVRYTCFMSRGNMEPSCIPEPAANIQVIHP